MARYKNETKMVRFSYDNGQTWSFINFNENNVFVSNIVIEPTNNDHHFLITGFEFNTKENVKKGVVFHLDFSEYHLRFCKGFEKPDENDSDYEKFVPHSYQNSKCNTIVLTYNRYSRKIHTLCKKEAKDQMYKSGPLPILLC